MIIEPAALTNALTHARQVSAFHAQLQLSTAQRKTPDTLLKVCRDYLQKKIEIFAVQMEPSEDEVRAFYLATVDGYEVYVLEQQGPAWRDFAACKELFHVVLDDPACEDCRTVQIFEHLQQVVDTCLPFDGVPNQKSVSEFLAEIAAMEFLFPYAERLKYVGDGVVADWEAIATAYHLPLPLVERYLSRGNIAFFAKFAES